MWKRFALWGCLEIEEPGVTTKARRSEESQRKVTKKSHKDESSRRVTKKNHEGDDSALAGMARILRIVAVTIQPSDLFGHELHEFSRVECENSWQFVQFVTKNDGS
jgi:hypothetical protein